MSAEDDENKWENKPTEEKVQHKLTKARQTGYAEFKTKLTTQKNFDYDNFLNCFGEKNFFNDTIELCREKAAELFVIFMDKAKQETILKSEPLVISGLVGNCLTGKPKTNAVKILLKFIEIDKKFLAIEALFKGSIHKNFKVGQACLDILKTAVKTFNLDCDKILPFMKPYMELIESKDKDIRQELKFLLAELHKKLGTKASSKIRSLLQNTLTDNKKIETLIQEIENFTYAKQAGVVESSHSTSLILISSNKTPAAVSTSNPPIISVSNPQTNDPETKTVEIIPTEIPQEKPVLESQPIIEQPPVPKQNKKINVDFKEIDNAVIKCVVKDGKFLSAGTIELLKTILPNYEPPSKKVINKNLDARKQEHEKDLTKLFKDVTDIALSSEILKNSRNSFYLCLRAHYYNENFQYKSVVISFKRFIKSDHLNIKINSFIKYELKKLNIANKIRTTTTNIENIVKVDENNEFGTRISCLVENLNSTIIHTLNGKIINEIDKDFHDESHYYDSTNEYDSENEETIETEEKVNETIEEYHSSYDTCDELNEIESNDFQINNQSINSLLNKVRKLVRFVSDSTELINYIRKEAKKENIQHKLLLDLPLRWHSTYFMIDSYLKHSKLIDDILVTRPAMISSSKIESLKSLKFDLKEIILLKSINEVLHEFYEQSLILQSKTFLPLSFSHVVISNLNKYLTNKSLIHNNSECVNLVKDLFYEKFLIYFENKNTSRERYLRLIATYLNPIHFRYLTQLEKIEVEKSLSNLEISFANAAKSIMSKNQSPDIVNGILGKIRSRSPSENGAYKLTVKEELVYYVVRIKQNNLLSHDESVHKTSLEKFWQQEKGSLAHLYSLFSKVCGTPSTSCNGQKSFSSQSYIERKNDLSLYSKKLSYSKVFEEI